MDIDAASATVIKVVRIRVSHNTAASDSNTRIKIYRKTAIGAGSTSGTAVRKDPLAPASTSAVTVKNGTSTYGAGTVTDTIDEIQVNGRGVFEWVARDDQDMITAASGGIIGVNILNNTASIVIKVTMEWIE